MHFQAKGCSQVPGLTLQLPAFALLPKPSPARDRLWALASETAPALIQSSLGSPRGRAPEPPWMTKSMNAQISYIKWYTACI